MIIEFKVWHEGVQTNFLGKDWEKALGYFCECLRECKGKSWRDFPRLDLCDYFELDGILKRTVELYCLCYISPTYCADQLMGWFGGSLEDDLLEEGGEKRSDNEMESSVNHVPLHLPIRSIGFLADSRNCSCDDYSKWPSPDEILEGFSWLLKPGSDRMIQVGVYPIGVYLTFCRVGKNLLFSPTGEIPDKFRSTL